MHHLALTLCLSARCSSCLGMPWAYCTVQQARKSARKHWAMKHLPYVYEQGVFQWKKSLSSADEASLNVPSHLNLQEARETARKYQAMMYLPDVYQQHIVSFEECLDLKRRQLTSIAAVPSLGVLKQGQPISSCTRFCFTTEVGRSPYVYQQGVLPI